MISSITLQELLQPALEESIIWLSCNDNTHVPIEWISISLEEARGGDLLLIPGTLLSTELAFQAQARGIPAILGLGKPIKTFEDFPESISIGYLAKHKEDIRDIQRRLLAILINERAALIERGTEIHTRLSQLEAEGKGLIGIIYTMAEITGKGVLIQDKRGNVLAHKLSTVLQPNWEELLQRLSDLNSLPVGFRDRKKSANNPKMLSQPLGNNYSRSVAPIIVGEIIRGYLSMITADADLNKLDYLVLENGAQVCAIEMARNKAIRETEKRLKGDLLSAILQENLTPRDAGLWLQSMGLDINHAHIALRFSWEGSASPSRRRLETIINGEINRHGLKAIVHPMGSEVICFCQINGNSNRPDDVLDFSKSVLNQAIAEYPDASARCGIGTRAKSLEDWRSSLGHAGQALEMARRLRETKPLYYSDLSIYRLLFQIEHSPELIAFEEEIIGELLSLDGSEELIRTLEAFFKHNGNLSQTAEALFIHRNTLIYRLERIATITNLDLDKPENRLAIQLALHIHRMTAPLSP